MANERVMIQKQSDLTESVRALSVNKRKLEQDIVDLSKDKKAVVDEIDTIQKTLKDRLEMIDIIQQDSEKERARLSQLNTYLTDWSESLKQTKLDIERDALLVSNLIALEKSEAQSVVEELTQIKVDLESNIKELLAEQEFLNDQNDSILSDIEHNNHIQRITQQEVRDVKDSLEELHNEYNKSSENIEYKLSKKQKELEEKGEVESSIRTELKNKEQELKEREENLTILQSRLQSQIKEYFPHINIKI